MDPKQSAGPHGPKLKRILPQRERRAAWCLPLVPSDGAGRVRGPRRARAGWVLLSCVWWVCIHALLLLVGPLPLAHCASPSTSPSHHQSHSHSHSQQWPPRHNNNSANSNSKAHQQTITDAAGMLVSVSRAYPYAGRRAAEDACTAPTNSTPPSSSSSSSSSSSGRLPAFFSTRWAATRPHSSPPPPSPSALATEEGGLGEGVAVLAPGSLEILKRLGTGKFSEVFEAWWSGGSRRVALKVLRPLPDWRVRREVAMLQAVRGGPNVATLLGASNTFRHALVLEAHPGGRHLEHGEDGLSDFEIRFFLFELLRALDWAHSRGVMHRDVKNRNVIINTTPPRALSLVDWGSADYYIDGHPNNVFVATRFFKAPELLVGYPYYDYSLDLWGVGAMLAGLLFKREPFFRGVDDEDQLVRIVHVLGTQGLTDYCHKYNIPIKKELRSKVGRHSRKAWRQFLSVSNKHLCSIDALDLLDKLLRYDPCERLTAREALEHDFFEPIRRMRGYPLSPRPSLPTTEHGAPRPKGGLPT